MSSSICARGTGRIRARTGLVTGLSLVVLAAVPAIASGATVTSAAGTITYQAAPGETNNVVADDPSSTYTFAETGIIAGAGCTQTNANLVTCSDSGVNIVIMNLDDMADTANAGGSAEDDFQINGGNEGDNLTLSDANGDVGNGGEGADTIAGDGGTDTLNGGNGDDALIGDAGADDINGDAGNDRLDGGNNGNEDDNIDGGSGIDRLVFGIIPGHTYTCGDQELNIDLDAGADDDFCSDGSSDDNVVLDTVESITGSTLSDTLTGSCFANTFAGSAGTANGHADNDDILNGDPAAGCSPGSGDFFGGGEGSDDFNGDGAGLAGFDTVTYGTPYTGVTGLIIDWGGGNDDTDGMGNSDDVQTDIERVIGGGAGDTINATAAAQGVQLFGRLGGDTLTGSGFGDHLNGEDGTDSLNCLGGTDTFSDPSNADTIDPSCETEI